MKHSNLLLLIFLLLLASCANRAQTGAVGGGAAGAAIGQAIGHNTGATLIGAAVGTLVGYIVGNEMDKYDREQLNHTYERGISNQRSAWVNPDNGNQYAVTPQPAYQNPATQKVCRRAEIQAIIDGKTETTYSTACRDTTGRWVLQ
jgi:surface antigen